MKIKLNFIPIIVVAAIIFISPRSANAYIDPGTGSYIFQILLALLFGISLSFKVITTKIINIFKFLTFRNVKKEEKDDEK